MRRVHKRAHNFKDLSGLTFGRLTVVGIDPSSQPRDIRWLCRCACGSSGTFRGGNLKSGATTSCGCFQREMSVQRHKTHGASRTAEFSVWAGMWQRCTNPKHAGYSKYKDRAPPERWRDFSAFLSDMGSRPSVYHSLERVRNEEPYGPDNCVWATRKTNARNTSRSILVVLQGSVVSLPEACDRTGAKYANVKARWYRWGDMLRASNGLFDVISTDRSYGKSEVASC